MTIDEAIKLCEEDAEKIGGNPQSDYHAYKCKLMANWLKELKEARRLLKAAVEDLAKIPCNNDVYIPSSCDACIKQGNCDYSDSFKWRYADEAKKLIGGSENG